MLAKNTHQVSHEQSLGDRNLLGKTRQFSFPVGKYVRRGRRERRLRALRRRRPRPQSRPTVPTTRRVTIDPLHRKRGRLPHTLAMVVIHAYRQPLVAVPDDMVAQRAQAAQRVHPRDGLVRHRAARHDAEVPGAPLAPGHSPTARVRADARQEGIGGEVQRLLAARLAAAPAVADDVQRNEPVGQVIGEAARGRLLRPRVRHRVLRNGEVAGRRAGCEFWEVQREDGAVRGVDVLNDQVGVAGQRFAARVEYVLGVQKFVADGREVAFLSQDDNSIRFSVYKEWIELSLSRIP